MYIVPSKIWLIYACFLKRWNKYLTTQHNYRDRKYILYNKNHLTPVCIWTKQYLIWILHFATQMQMVNVKCQVDVKIEILIRIGSKKTKRLKISPHVATWIYSLIYVFFCLFRNKSDAEIYIHNFFLDLKIIL